MGGHGGGMTSNDLHQVRLNKFFADLRAARAALNAALEQMAVAARDGQDGAQYRADADTALDRIDQIQARPLASY